MPESLKSIWRFLAAFTTSMLAKMSGAISALAFIATFFFSGFARGSFYAVSATAFVVASYAIWKPKEDEIAELRKRPHDDAVKTLVTTQLNPLGTNHRDILRYLAVSGDVWADKLLLDSGVAEAVLNLVLTETAQTQLITYEQRPVSGRPGLHVCWLIPSQHLPVIKDILFPRVEAAPQELFKNRITFPPKAPANPIASNWQAALILVGIVAVALGATKFCLSLQRNRDLAETLLWMDQTYNPHEGGDNLGQGHGWEIHYIRKGQEEEVTQKFKMTFTRLGDCNIAIKSETLPEGVYSETPNVDTYTFNLCDIDPDSIKIKTYDLHKDVFSCADPEQVKLYELDCDNGEIEFSTRNGATTIAEEAVNTFTKLSGTDHELKTATKTNKCWLIVDDIVYAQRLEKALRHAIDLCGGKPSRF
jgi:hypothetical protein